MKKIGVIAIIVKEGRKSIVKVNEILSDYAAEIHGRMGVPNLQKDVCVISLIVEMDSDTLGALTGKLGQLSGVTVKSVMAA